MNYSNTDVDSDGATAASAAQIVHGEVSLPLYSKPQWLAMLWTPRISSTLSIIGSLLIIFMICRGGKERMKKIHNRLLMGMSFMDIINSVALGLFSTPFPKKLSSIIYGASGSTATCTAQGFFITLGFSVPMYNCFLCLYYLAVIKYNVKDDILEKYEIYAHVISILLPLAGSTVGAAFGVFRPTIKAYCWVADGCRLSTLLQQVSSSSDPGDDASPTCPVSFQELVAINFVKISYMALTFITFTIIAYSMVSIYLSVRKQTKTMSQYQTFERGNSIHGSSEKKSTLTETFQQSSLYIAAFFCSNIWPIITALIKGKVWFPVMIAKAVFYPLQGFFNFCTYIRPRFVVLRETNKDASFFRIMKMVVFVNGLDEEQKKAKARRESRIALIERSKMKQGGRNSIHDRFNHNSESLKKKSNSIESQRHEMKDIENDKLNEEHSNSIELSSVSESTCIDGDAADIHPRAPSTINKTPKDKDMLSLDTKLESPVLAMHGSFEQNGNNTSVSSPLTSLIAQDLFSDNNISPKSATTRRGSLPLLLRQKQHDWSDSDGDSPTKRVVRFGPSSFPVSLRDIEQNSDCSPPKLLKTTDCCSSADGMESEQSIDHSSKDNANNQSNDSSVILGSPKRKTRRDSLPFNMHLNSPDFNHKSFQL